MSEHIELKWFEHRFGGHTAPTAEGHYLIQADHIVRHGVRLADRYQASLILRRRPQIGLGFHPTIKAAKKACELNQLSRWDEDMEAGAIG